MIPVEQATDYFSERIRVNPSDAFAYMMRATLRHDKQQLDPGDRRLQSGDQARLHRMPGCLIIEESPGPICKEYDQALADFNEAIRLDGRNANVYNNRGTIWRKKKVFRAAMADFDRAIQLQPRYAFAYYNRGLTWADQKQYVQGHRRL